MISDSRISSEGAELTQVTPNTHTPILFLTCYSIFHTFLLLVIDNILSIPADTI